MRFRAAFTWGKVLGRTFRGHGRAALVAESSMQAKWARLERCAVLAVAVRQAVASTALGQDWPAPLHPCQRDEPPGSRHALVAEKKNREIQVLRDFSTSHILQ